MYEVLKMNRFHGLSLETIRTVVGKVLDILQVMGTLGIVHCDLKPENILICEEGSSGTKAVAEDPSACVKVIDFGSACSEGQMMFSYIQSRFYRAPEVLLGYGYDRRIDIWSLGCIAAELFLGLPIFPGASQYDQLSRIITTMQCVPSADMIVRCRFGAKYFTQSSDGGALCLKRREVFVRENPSESSVVVKKYFGSLETWRDLAMSVQKDRLVSPSDFKQRDSFIDIVCRMLAFNPADRWAADGLLCHPFMTGVEYSPDTPLGASLPVVIPGVAARRDSRSICFSVPASSACLSSRQKQCVGDDSRVKSSVDAAKVEESEESSSAASTSAIESTRRDEGESSRTRRRRPRHFRFPRLDAIREESIDVGDCGVSESSQGESGTSSLAAPEDKKKAAASTGGRRRAMSCHVSIENGGKRLAAALGRRPMELLASSSASSASSFSAGRCAGRWEPTAVGVKETTAIGDGNSARGKDVEEKVKEDDHAEKKSVAASAASWTSSTAPSDEGVALWDPGFMESLDH